MKNLLNPKWIILINSIPTVILLFLSYGEFAVIKTLLKEENINLWIIFGSAIATLGLANLGYSIFLIIKKREISILYTLAALTSNIAVIYLTAFYYDDIIPWSIPQWMQSGDVIMYVGTYLMPTLAYSLFLIVIHLSNKVSKHQEWKDLLSAAIIPVIGFVFGQIILPSWQLINSKFSMHTLLIIIIIGILLVLFFLIRSIYILINKKSNFWKKHQLLWKIPLTILFPLLGLIINNGGFEELSFISNGGMFGNFSSYWFYGLTITNGLLLCLPNKDNLTYRIFTFIGRSILFPFTFYFFVVFLPFFPLSILTIFAFGAGVLLLNPLVVFIIHANQLSKDVVFLKQSIPYKSIWTIVVIGFIAIPTSITLDYHNDRLTLHQALDYIYSPSYSSTYDIDTKSLRKTIDVVKVNKRNGSPFGRKQPYLSSYYKWIVLDNLSLSDKKTNTIERIFFNTSQKKYRRDSIDNNEVTITNLEQESTYDEIQNAWVSWVNLEITNSQKNQAEYASTIDLPTGTWISDYYLYVGDKKEFGMLSEKKSAMWVFSQIRNKRKDPGILYYLTGNKVAFRIFPFQKEEVRLTGFQLVHKEPISFTIDNRKIQLGHHQTPTNSIEKGADDRIQYISVKEKKALPKVNRQPYFHYLIDSSEKIDSLPKNYTSEIETLNKKYPILAKEAKYTFVNTYASDSFNNSNWESAYNDKSFVGGFYLERAIKQTLINSYNAQNNSYPVIVIITNDLTKALLNKDFSDYEFTMPDNNSYYHLNEEQKLDSYSLLHTPRLIKEKDIKAFNHKEVLQYQQSNNSIKYLANNNKPSILLKKDVFEITPNEIQLKNWKSGLLLYGKRLSTLLHPEITDDEWLDLIKYSFMSKIMIPETSYLVVENDAQKVALKRKQKEVLSSKKSLDIGNETQRMSEPSLWILLLLGLLFIFYKNRKEKLI